MNVVVPSIDYDVSFRFPYTLFEFLTMIYLLCDHISSYLQFSITSEYHLSVSGDFWGACFCCVIEFGWYRYIVLSSPSFIIKEQFSWMKFLICEQFYFCYHCNTSVMWKGLCIFALEWLILGPPKSDQLIFFFKNLYFLKSQLYLIKKFNIELKNVLVSIWKTKWICDHQHCVLHS